MQPSSSSILVKSLVATDHCITLLFGQLRGGLTRAPADAGGTCMLHYCVTLSYCSTTDSHMRSAALLVESTSNEGRSRTDHPSNILADRNIAQAT